MRSPPSREDVRAHAAAAAAALQAADGRHLLAQAVQQFARAALLEFRFFVRIVRQLDVREVGRVAVLREQFQQRTLPAVLAGLGQVDGERHDVAVGRRVHVDVRAAVVDLAGHFEDLARRQRPHDGERRRAVVGGRRFRQQLVAAVLVIRRVDDAVDVV
ncbi:conserved hypothetical protein, partial [Ricinus communis]